MLCREGPRGDNQPDLPPLLPICPAGAPHSQTYWKPEGCRGPRMWTMWSAIWEHGARGRVGQGSGGGHWGPPVQGRCHFSTVLGEGMTLELSPENKKDQARRRASRRKGAPGAGNSRGKRVEAGGAGSRRPGGRELAFYFKFSWRQGVSF